MKRFDEIVEAVGERSFGSILLLAGIITLTPLIGDIPGVPSIMGLIVFLIAIQLLIGRTLAARFYTQKIRQKG